MRRNSRKPNNLSGLKNKDWVRKGMNQEELAQLERIFHNFDIQKTGTIDGRKLYQAFKALNMQKRSPDVFDIVCKIAKIDKPINLQEFIDIIGGTMGNCETMEGGEVVFDRIATGKYIWKDEDKQVPKDLRVESEIGLNPRDGSEVDEDEERDQFQTNVPGFGYEGEGDEFQEMSPYDENGLPQLTSHSFGSMTLELGRNMSAEEIDELFMGANDGNFIMDKETFMGLYEKKVLNIEEEEKGKKKK